MWASSLHLPGADPSKDVARWTWEGTPANLAVHFTGLDGLHLQVLGDEGSDITLLRTDEDKARNALGDREAVTDAPF